MPEVPLLPLVLLVGGGVVVEVLPELLAVAWYCAKVLVCVGFIANTIPAWQWLAGFV